MGIFHSKSLGPAQLKDLLENTQFDKQELEKRYKNFQHKYRSGRLNRDQFFEEYGQFSQEIAACYFDIFDKDKNGTIDFTELMCAESIRLHDNPRFAFDLYDADRDGYITRDEMLQITRIIYKSMGDMNLVTLPDDEATPEQFVDKIFLDEDLNKDNKLSYEEFVRHMSSVGS